MREIKFRCWITDCPKPFMAHFGLRGLDGDYIKQHSSYLNGTVMQYTGLHDKNGREIYEGDILQLGEHWDQTLSFHRLPVEWNARGQFDPFGTDDWAVEGEEVEVIGNIYESPELLNDK